MTFNTHDMAAAADLQARFPEEIPELKTWSDPLPLFMTAKQKHFASALHTVDSLMHFGDVSATHTFHSAQRIDIPMAAELVFALEDFFLDNTENLVKSSDSALKFLGAWPTWDRWAQDMPTQCVDGLPYLSWNAADKIRIVNNFTELCNQNLRLRLEGRKDLADDAIAPVGINISDIMRFVGDMSDMRCAYIVFSAVARLGYTRYKRFQQNLRNALYACCGWCLEG